MFRTALIASLAFALVTSGQAKNVPDTHDFDCDGREGIFADPEDCRSFYQCTYDAPAYHNTCASHLLFDDVALTCDYDYNVDCHGRPIPGEPTPDPNATTVEPPPETTADPDPITTKYPPVETTTEEQNPGEPPILRYPSKTLGMYILLADETEEGFESNSDSWTPELYEYQQNAFNVLFFTFVNPETMEVPISFQKLAATRGTSSPGAVPEETIILFAIGGYLYSQQTDPWEWLTSKEAAEAMAEQVAEWPSLYGCDGIDLDIEEGAGSRPEAGPNMIHFIRRLRELQPDIIIGQPTYGYPQVQAEIDVINASWNPGQTSNNLADSVGLMVYEGSQSIQYVDNYAHGTDQYDGFPITVDVPEQQIFLGSKGVSNPDDIDALMVDSINRDLLGIMVWYSSVKNGFQYEPSWDTSFDESSQDAFLAVMAQYSIYNNKMKQ